MSRNGLVFWCLWLLTAMGALAGTSEDLRRRLVGDTHQSLSGQFVIHNSPSAGANPSAAFGNAPEMVQLNPALLAVSCERIKLALLSRLNTPDQWRGKIYIALHHAKDLNDEIAVAPARIANNWAYYVELPDVIERSRLVSAMVEMVLLEMADREVDHSTEVPAWLVQGLSREIQAASMADLVINTPKSFENGINLSRANKLAQPNEDLEKLRLRLRGVLPLTFEQLSWPAQNQLLGDAGEAYRDSAQLFVHELLMLPEGHAALLAMLRDLPNHLNWQLAFFKAFNAKFSTQREVQQWWDLCVSQFCGRTLSEAWANDDTWKRLEEATHQEVEVRTGIRELPTHNQLTLQMILSEWEPEDRKAVLRQKLHDLTLLQMRSSPDYLALVAAYRQALENYMHRRETRVDAIARKDIVPERIDEGTRELIRELDQLDMQRSQARLQKQSSLASPFQAGSTR